MRTIGFDLDGTILEVGLRDYQIYYELITEENGKAIPFEEYWLLRKNQTNIFTILADSQYPEHRNDYFLRARSERMEEMQYLKLVKVFDDVQSVVKKLKRKYRCVIVTKRHNWNNTNTQIKVLKLDELFDDYIITGSSSKLEAYKSVGNLCLIVGDTEKDLEAANCLGVPSVGLTTGIRNRKILERFNPTMILDNFTELYGYIMEKL